MRKSVRSTWLLTLPPIGAARHHYKLYLAEIQILATCLVFGGARFWCGISILFCNPELIQEIPTQMENDDAEMTDAPFGESTSPYYYGASPPDIFSGGSHDLVDFCSRRNRWAAAYFIFSSKAGVVLNDNKWRDIFADTAKVPPSSDVDVTEFLDHRMQKAKRPSMVEESDADAAEVNRRSKNMRDGGEDAQNMRAAAQNISSPNDDRIGDPILTGT